MCELNLLEIEFFDIRRLNGRLFSQFESIIRIPKENSGNFVSKKKTNFVLMLELLTLISFIKYIFNKYYLFGDNLNMFY